MEYHRFPSGCSQSVPTAVRLSLIHIWLGLLQDREHLVGDLAGLPPQRLKYLHGADRHLAGQAALEILMRNNYQSVNIQELLKTIAYLFAVVMLINSIYYFMPVSYTHLDFSTLTVSELQLVTLCSNDETRT